MIKVVHFIHGLNMGGAETLVKNYALLLDKKKFDVKILCLNHEESPYEKILNDAGIEVIYLRDELKFGYSKSQFAKFVNYYGFYYHVVEKIKKLNPDILHVHLMLSKYLTHACLSKQLILFYTHHYDIPSWINEHPNDVQNWRDLIRKYITKIIALTPKMRDEIDSLFDVSNTAVLNNGIDLELYKERDVIRNEKRKMLDVPRDAFVIAHVGRFDPVKNHDFLIKVFSQIKKKKSEAFLLMVGRGETEETVRNQLESAGLADSYRILHDRTDVAEILQTCDAAVFPSFSEGLGIAVIEMQAAGLCCVASTGVPKDACVSNKLRFLSLEQSADVWADTLLEMTASKTPIQYDGLEEWDIRHNVKQLEKMYEEAMENIG